MESGHAKISPEKQAEIDRQLRAAEQQLQAVGK
jgi:hypothetical protein